MTPQGLQAVASGHRMTGLPEQVVPVPTRTQREPATHWGRSPFLSRVGLWPVLVDRLKIKGFHDHERLRLSGDPIGIDVIAVWSIASGSSPEACQWTPALSA